ncbi:hypothetical protein NEUTE1DRAFT_111367 [Neurospora tetrasperma FGSC 2508]|uniref:Uncharacterized protein n=1 Tax=Neurospora tetrasperma (strain FGSC 2508 / ATCC MYA-4615 / P0657) TaxID=510951 RepID=F8MNM2_NEUT8|nr:uncharacterized protein NEUTE1DRAFT_111367 [Neurospora tetrasperma FGSC 2508]EGO56990.1 hypothetical protein NEUTE1DRAFT_111367 [Neurospora tetrasperma FGSC 2508]EGZ70108.1 hypothetical protein NEUTE2DRAFT_130130 [Neurospora tetrasperma FGSC 2509]
MLVIQDEDSQAIAPYLFNPSSPSDMAGFSILRYKVNIDAISPADKHYLVLASCKHLLVGLVGHFNSTRCGGICRPAAHVTFTFPPGHHRDMEMKPGADHFKLVRDAWLLTKPKQDIYPPTERPVPIGTNADEADITRRKHGLLWWNYLVIMSNGL